MEENYFNFDYKTRYFQSGKLDAQTKEVWIVLHGYGQLASFFLRKFSGLINKDTCIIAPEGLSRFYLEGFSGRVGATWMTKEDRITDIQNYLHYLNNLYSKIIAPKISSDTKITLLGFSQGCATLMRWIVDDQINFDRVILWAGVVPPDIDFSKGKKLLKNKPFYFVYGKEDPFLKESSFEDIFQLFKKLDIQPGIHTFEGGHHIDENTLLKLFSTVN